MTHPQVLQNVRMALSEHYEQQIGGRNFIQIQMQIQIYACWQARRTSGGVWRPLVGPRDKYKYNYEYK